ncbi:hypothetical protein [Blattabacterium cuenoti]|uniref:hypothetical protein n=1 Tax=Blattabacterium cuenoti TaxID=1653831 RepID=UPI00311F1771
MKYEFLEGKIWSYENLFSPFNFLVTKNSQDIDLEIQKLKRNQEIFCIKNEKTVKNIKKKLKKISILRKNKHYNQIVHSIINTIYKYGYLDNYDNFTKQNKNYIIFLRKDKTWIPILYQKIITYDKINDLIEKNFRKKSDRIKILKKILRKIIVPNLFYSQYYTDFF